MSLNGIFKLRMYVNIRYCAFCLLVRVFGRVDSEVICAHNILHYCETFDKNGCDRSYQGNNYPPWTVVFVHIVWQWIPRITMLSYNGVERYSFDKWQAIILIDACQQLNRPNRTTPRINHNPTTIYSSHRVRGSAPHSAYEYTAHHHSKGILFNIQFCSCIYVH